MPRSSGTMTLPAGNPVVSGTVISTTWANGTMNDIANEITNSIPRDGTAPPTANIPMGNFKLTGIGAATLSTDVPQYQQIQSGASQYLTAVAGTNTITASATAPTLTAYAAGNTFRFVAAGANTGAVTLNVNGLGAKAIKLGAIALVGGEIATGTIVEVTYDGTQFQLISVYNFLQSGTGAVARTVQSKARDIVSVKDFGAVGDGVTDDTTAVQAAVNAAVTLGYKLHVPGGVYLLSNKITVTGALVIIGDGVALSQFKWGASSTASTSGIDVTVDGVSGLSKTVEVRQVALVTGAAALGTALKVTGSASLAADRITPRLIIKDIFIRGASNPSTDGWAIGIHADNCSKTNIDGVSFWGKVNGAGEPTYDSVNAVKYSNSVAASPHPTEFNIINSFLTYAQNAILCDDFEGGLIKGNQIIGVNTGVRATGASTFPHVDISQNHINASGTCVLIERMYEAVITNNLLYKELGASAGSGIDIQLGASFFSIQGNIFENLSAVTNMNAVIVTSGSEGLIDGNIFRRCDATDGSPTGLGIWLTAGATNCVVGRNNKFTSTTTLILNSGTGNKVAQTTLAAAGSTTNADGLIEKWGSVVVTLDASGNGTIAYPTAFPNSYYAATVCSGDPSFASGAAFSINHGSSTTANLLVSVRPNPGAISVRVNYSSKGR